MLDFIRRLAGPSLRGELYDDDDQSRALAAVYGRVGRRTIQRDLHVLDTQGLLIERDGRLAPNIEIMSEFAED